MFPACPAEMIPTLQLKTWELPILTVSVQVRLAMFTTSQFPFNYRSVQVLNHDRPGSSSRQGGNSIGQDRKCNQQAIEIQFPGGWSQGPDT